MTATVCGNHVPIRNMSTTDRFLSVVGGALIAAAGARKRSGTRPLAMLFGLEMVRRGVSGHCYAYQFFGIRTKAADVSNSVSVPYELGIRATNSITINQPREQLFAFWRNFKNLPNVMTHLISVEPNGENRSHWVAQGPKGRHVEWDAEIINEIQDELIGWRSLPESQVQNAGSVRFKDAPGGRGTEIIVELQYNPPAGFAGAYVAKLFGRDPETEIEEDLYRLKQYIETGELATTAEQPRGGQQKSQPGEQQSDSVAENLA